VLAPGVKTSGSVNSSDTADYYKFTVVNGENISIKLESDSDHLWGQLTDPTQNELISDTGYTVIGVPTYANWTTVSTVTGFYFFIVKTNGEGFYNLTLTITEPNDAGLGIDAGDTFPTATPITNGTYHGWLGYSDDLDYYKFVVVSAQIINIEFRVGTVGTQHIYAILYDPAQSSIHDLDWVQPGLNASYMYMTSVMTAGTYYIKVGNGQSNDYTLKVQLTAQNDATIGHDASDTDTAPVMVTSGTLYNGAIGDDDEKDIYGFTVANASIIKVFMKTGIKGLNGITGQHLYNKLYNPAKSQLVDSDWIEPDLSTSYNWTTSSAQPGIYYIVVLGGYNSYSFRVTIIAQNDANQGKDATDTFPGLTLVPGTNYPGWIFNDDEKDYYNINLTHGQILTVNLTEGAMKTANKQYLKLYDAAKVQVKDTDYIISGTTGSLKYTSSYETAGIYYILVEGNDNDYKFSVNVQNQTDAGTQIDAPEAYEKAINLKTGTYSGGMADIDNVDMYNISVKSNNVFTVNFTAGVGGTSSMYLDIYDAAKVLVETLTSAPDVKATYTLPGGDAPLTNSLFYLKVHGGDSPTYKIDVYLPERPPDTTPPVVAIATPANGASFKIAIIDVTGTATDVGGTIAKVEWALNNSTFNNCTGTGAWTCAVTLAAGGNTVTIRALDSSGNKGYKALATLSFDGTAPTVNVTLVDGSKTSKSKLTVTGTSTDNIGTTAWSAELVLKTGTNTIVVRVTDTAGNTVEKTTTVTYKKSTSGGKGFIPGFEVAIFIGAALVGLVVLSRRKLN
jgi:hypothetical protein